MPTGRHDHLTKREHEIVMLLAQGRSAKEVAAALSIAPGTVEKHIETVMIKLRARNRVQMALLAAADGLIDLAICRTQLGPPAYEEADRTARLPRRQGSP